jgi:hypothetical protein
MWDCKDLYKDVPGLSIRPTSLAPATALPQLPRELRKIKSTLRGSLSLSNGIIPARNLDIREACWVLRLTWS